MIYVKDLYKSFGKNEVLKGIDEHIAKGEVVLFPEPDGPITTTTSPLAICSSIPFSISLSPKLLYKSLTYITCLHSPFHTF